ncbi:MAG: hypothetical protein H6830_04775 [Planctomycetes bacterium]|nr:hypothetical protein [Planctomycetota bacterium]MCB9911254.1 hypothetical protein [Planctomycetota bacterium]
MKRTTLLAISVPLFWFLGSCGSGEPQGPATDPVTPPNGAKVADSNPGALRWTTPKGWSEVPPGNAQRERQYALQTPDGGSLDVIVSHWPGKLGGVDANVSRWRSSLGLGEGDDEPLVETESRNGLLITLFDGQGSYTDMAGVKTPSARLLTAFVESPVGRFEGVYTLKLSGTADQVAPWAESFRNFVLGL